MIQRKGVRNMAEVKKTRKANPKQPGQKYVIRADFSLLRKGGTYAASATKDQA